MLLFRSEEDIDRWCAQTGEPRGEALPLEQVWQLSRRWYADRMSPEFRGRSLDQVLAIFREAGLTTPFWLGDAS